VRIEWRQKLALGFVLLWMAAYSGLSLAAARDPLDAAQTAFNRGQADEALRDLDQTLRGNSRNAAAWNLQCRIYLAQARWDDAITSCQRAVQIAPENSGYHLWLGRAYGEKASRAKLVAAYQTAKLAHAEFEAAVALDGQNRQALSDLGQYYVEAPRILGGGYLKAEDLVERLNVLDPVRADELKARIAEAKKDYADADQNWRARIAILQSSPDEAAQAWMDLGSFYRRRGQWDQMLAALKSGATADRNHGPALVDGASTLIAAGREPTLAAQWLRAYLDGNALSETAPAFAVHAKLGDLLKKQGDIAGADREFAAARALSANYSEAATLSAGY
jgi:tetratricopeptide (TPR) repeat protein